MLDCFGIYIYPSRIHGTGVFTYMISVKNGRMNKGKWLGKYSCPMDPKGYTYLYHTWLLFYWINGGKYTILLFILGDCQAGQIPRWDSVYSVI